MRRLESFAVVLAVLGFCVAFWVGLAWLVLQWLRAQTP